MVKAKKNGDVPMEPASSESALPTAAVEKPVKKRSPKNKTQAVRRALRRLGWDAKPPQVKDWVWSHYRMEIDNGHISTIKSMLLRQMREEGGGGEEEEPVAVSATTHAERIQSNGPGSLSIAELRMIKELVTRIGRERFRDLADLFNS